MNEAREQKNNHQEKQKDSQSFSLVTKGGKIYFPISLIAKEFSYAADHVARLARQKKIDAVREDKRWFIVRESLVAYREQARQNKINGGLKSTEIFSGRLQNKVLENRESFSGDETVLYNNRPSLKDRPTIVLSSENTQDKKDNKDNRFNFIGEYLSGARTKTTNRAKLILVVFLIFIISGTFVLSGTLVSRSLSNKILSNIYDREENSQLASIGIIDFFKKLFKPFTYPIQLVKIEEKKEK